MHWVLFFSRGKKIVRHSHCCLGELVADVRWLGPREDVTIVAIDWYTSSNAQEYHQIPRYSGCNDCRDEDEQE
jgi:hypothetical protein